MKKQQRLEIAKFCLVGGISVLIGYIILYVLTEYVSFWYLASSIIAFFVSNTISFMLQKFWTFKDTERKNIYKKFVLYMIVTIVYFLINTAGIYTITEYFHIYYILSQIIMTIILSISSYFTSRIIFAH